MRDIYFNSVAYNISQLEKQKWKHQGVLVTTGNITFCQKLRRFTLLLLEFQICSMLETEDISLKANARHLQKATKVTSDLNLSIKTIQAAWMFKLQHGFSRKKEEKKIQNTPNPAYMRTLMIAALSKASWKRQIIMHSIR